MKLDTIYISTLYLIIYLISLAQKIKYFKINIIDSPESARKARFFGFHIRY